MRSMLDSIFERINDLRNQKLEQKKFLTDRISNTETQLMVVTREMKMKIHNMVEEVEQKVSKALSEEIWRLNVLVDEFNSPFHTDALVLNVYKKEMNGYVEPELRSNLRARLPTALAMNIGTAQRESTERMTALVHKKFNEATRLLDANIRQLHNDKNSPLQIFVKAKKNINEIFGNISEYVVETTSFIKGKMNQLIRP